jgi:hypothetical protein
MTSDQIVPGGTEGVARAMEVRILDGGACVRLRGTLDIANVLFVEDRLRRLMLCGMPSERLDLRGVECGDATGAEYLERWVARARRLRRAVEVEVRIAAEGAAHHDGDGAGPRAARLG